MAGFTEEEWSSVTNYLISQIREYCAKNSIDKEDFSKKLGVSSRVLTRFYSKKVLQNEKRNNKLLSSLEFFKNLAEALEMDVVRLFKEIHVFSHKKTNDIDALNKINDDKLSDIIDNKILIIYKNIINSNNEKNCFEMFLTFGIITSFLKESSFKKIMNIIEDDDFNHIPVEYREIIFNKIKLIGMN